MGFRVESEAEPIPGYRLIERLGGGGFGEVWKVMAPGGILKAIKFVYGDLDAAQGDGPRAEQELKALNRIKTVRHPYVLSLERYDIIDGQLMIVMELADQNLWDRFRECRAQGLLGIPREELLRYMEEASEALDLMSSQFQLQHLDIKPQNIFLVFNHVKVADFGLVKDLEGMMASVTGGVTPVYAAPETFDGWISRFCDQYSLAIVYQELLTGQRPFAGNNVRQLILQHLQSSPNLAPLPEADRAAVGRALAKNPEDRFPTCMDLVRALRGATRVEQPAPISAAPAAESGSSPPSPAKEPIRPSANGGLTREPAIVKTPVGGTMAPSSHDSGWIRVQDAAERTPSERFFSPALRQEVSGDGFIFPALVIGLGQLGLRVLKALRGQLNEHYGNPDSLQHIRLLYMDTDPEALHSAVDGPGQRNLSANEILFAKLNRPSYYLRSHQGRERIQAWFNFKMLYRIPRNLTTTGLRPLGRLAFVDNYRQIVRRLRSDLDACTLPDVLGEVSQRTGLKLRTNRPKVYVVTGLAGGTGGGMFIDLAYVARELVRELGFSKPENVGLFLLPPVDRNPGQTMALGNTFAALTELYHFSAAETTFSARYDDNGRLADEAQAPYDRSIMLTLPESDDEAPMTEFAEYAAGYLVRDLMTPLGRSLDEGRALVAEANPMRAGYCETFGLYSISWPRQALLRVAARRVCHQLVKRWLSKDANALREPVAQAVRDYWSKENLTGDALLTALQAAANKALGPPADVVIAGITEVLTRWENQPDMSPALPGEVLARVHEMVGQPEGSMGYRPGSLLEPLRAEAQVLTTEWGRKLATFTVMFVEEPRFRLAGAEESARQTVGALERLLQHYEPLHKELVNRAADAYGRIGPLIASLMPAQAKGRGASVAGHLVELLRVYPKWQLQSLILQQLINVLVSVRGQISEQLRELNYCRVRLSELRQEFETPIAAPAASNFSYRIDLFPADCHSFLDAANQVLEAIGPPELEELDGRIQIVIRQQFSALLHICLTPSNLLKRLEEVMITQAEAYVGTRMVGSDVAEMYLEHYTQPDQVANDLRTIFESATPALSKMTSQGLPQEVRIFGVPPSPAGNKLLEASEEAFAGLTVRKVVSRDEIVLFRDIPQFPMGDLEHLGPLGYEAYRQVVAIDNFTPHSRTDISEWRAATTQR
jgi:serine/threonine protein kinase